MDIAGLDELIGRKVLRADVVVGGEEPELLCVEIDAPFAELRLIRIVHERAVLATAGEVETRVVVVACADLVEERIVVISGLAGHALAARERLGAVTIGTKPHDVRREMLVLGLEVHRFRIVRSAELA